MEDTVVGALCNIADLKTGNISTGSPAFALQSAYTAAMARMLRLPCRCGGATTDSLRLSPQSGYESMLSMLIACRNKVNLVVHSAGVMNNFAAVSYEKFIIDLEILDMVQYYLKDVPVFMSSLLQVPFIQHLIGPEKSVGIVCAQKRFLTDTHLKNVGIDLNSNFVIAGSQDEYGCPEFDNLWDHEKRPDVPEIYYDKAEKDMVSICRKFCTSHPEISALMLECTGMQPFARSVQQAVDLPVFSWGTLLDYAYSVVSHREYYGHV